MLEVSISTFISACSRSLFIVILIRKWWVGFASENWISIEQEVVRSHGISMTSEDQYDITPDHVICTVTSGGFRGGSGGLLEPPLQANSFNFMGKFMKNQVNSWKRTPLCGFEPPFKKSWIRPWSVM